MRSSNRQKKTPTRLIAALVGCAMMAAFPKLGSAQEQRTFSVDQIVGYFDTIVFGSELNPIFASTVVAKWQNPVGISVQGRATEEHREIIDGYIKPVEILTGLEFTQVDPSDDSPGISFIFVNRSEMARIPVPEEYREAVKTAAANANCYFLSWKKPASRIVKAIVVADIDRDPAIINSCLLEELVQSLGLPNDSNDLRPSIFSDQDRLYELAPQDRILLHTLYHPRMEPGLSREKALSVAREIVTDLANRHAKRPTSPGQAE